MSAVAKVEQQVDTAYAAARQALERASGNQAKAIGIMANRVRKDRVLRDAVFEPLIEYACGQAINHALRQQRSGVWNAPAAKPGMSDGDRVRLLAAGTLAMFVLPGGQRLGEATRSQVADAAEFYGKQAEDMGHKSRWLRLVAQSVPDDKTVGDVLTDERLSALKDEALSHE